MATLIAEALFLFSSASSKAQFNLKSYKTEKFCMSVL